MDMMSRKIRLRPDEVREFVREASKCDFDIDFISNTIYKKCK